MGYYHNTQMAVTVGSKKVLNMSRITGHFHSGFCTVQRGERFLKFEWENENLNIAFIGFEGMVLCAAAFTMQRNSTQSTQKSCFPSNVLFKTQFAMLWQVCITFGAET
jgi:hypothetical protein